MNVRILAVVLGCVWVCGCQEKRERPSEGPKTAPIPQLEGSKTAPIPATQEPKEAPAYGTTISFGPVTLNNETLDSAAPVLKVAAGGPIAGTIELHINRLGPATSIFPVAGTVSWDRNERVEISGHLDPGQHEVKYVIRQTAPQRPGTYWIFVSAGPLYNFNEILGCDHEAHHGGPSDGPYNNGNDVWDWTEDQFTAAFKNKPVPCIWNHNPGNWALARTVMVVVKDK